MPSQAKVGTEQIQDYSNTDKFYALILFDYGNYIISFNLKYYQKIGHNWQHTCVFYASKKLFFSRFVIRRSWFHKDWRHCIIWVLKLTSMAFSFNRFILCGAIVCVLCYGKSGTCIYIVCIFNTFPTLKVSTFQILVTVCECGQCCRCLSLRLEAFIYAYNDSLASLYLHRRNLSRQVLRIAYVTIRKQNYLYSESESDP